MRTSDSINEITKALAVVQGSVDNPTFNKENPHFKSKYADLATILNTVRPVLSKNGIALMQLTSMEDAGVVLYTRLVHTSGQWIESCYPVSASSKPQEIASGLTYAKRVSLSAIVGVAGEDDDDGNEANKTLAKTTPKLSIEKEKAPTLGAAESSAYTQMMITELDACASKEGLVAWAQSNSKRKQELSMEDQKKVTESFQAAQTRIREAA